jgi:hypothetical protein
MTSAQDIFKGSDFYSKLLDSFSQSEKLTVDLNSNEISKAIFYHTCKMKHAGWRMRVDFKRKKRHSLSDFFQDIIAFYIKASLPDTFEIELESKLADTQTDIAIKFNGQYIFIIEIKTNIGWDRQGPEKSFSLRIDRLSENFKVLKQNIIYVFEDHGNVSKNFSEKYWNKKIGKPVSAPTDFPFSQIKPLFNDNDPYYWKYEKSFNKGLYYKEFEDENIFQRAETNIVTKFEDIIEQIIKASVSIEKN